MRRTACGEACGMYGHPICVVHGVCHLCIEEEYQDELAKRNDERDWWRARARAWKQLAQGYRQDITALEADNTSLLQCREDDLADRDRWHRIADDRAAELVRMTKDRFQDNWRKAYRDDLADALGLEGDAPGFALMCDKVEELRHERARGDAWRAKYDRDTDVIAELKRALRLALPHLGTDSDHTYHPDEPYHENQDCVCLARAAVRAALDKEKP